MELEDLRFPLEDLGSPLEDLGSPLEFSQKFNCHKKGNGCREWEGVLVVRKDEVGRGGGLGGGRPPAEGKGEGIG